MTLLGDVVPPIGASRGLATDASHRPSRHDVSGSSNVMNYFSEKAPKSKVDELAVAARFREISNYGEAHTRDELKAIIKEARRNFDDANFPATISNATHSKKLFLVGGEKGTYQLSYIGKQYVDALPDKVKIKATKNGGKRKKKVRKAE